MAAPGLNSKTVSLLEKEPSERIWEARTGRIVGADEHGRPLVDFTGNARGPRIARRAVPLSPGALRAAIESGQTVELRFEDGDVELPIITALSSSETATAAEPLRLIEGRDELVLQCGKASITLRRNGKVIIKGTYVETHSQGVNRIKGGSIQFG